MPLSCTIAIKGYADEKAEELVASQDSDFEVDLLQTSAQQLEAYVDNRFEGLKRVNFFVSDGLLTTALIDTFSYTVYSDRRFSQL